MYELTAPDKRSNKKVVKGERPIGLLYRREKINLENSGHRSNAPRQGDVLTTDDGFNPVSLSKSQQAFKHFPFLHNCNYSGYSDESVLHPERGRIAVFLRLSLSKTKLPNLNRIMHLRLSLPGAADTATATRDRQAPCHVREFGSLPHHERVNDNTQRHSPWWHATHLV